jgi:hypothetical protein
LKSSDLDARVESSLQKVEVSAQRDLGEKRTAIGVESDPVTGES